MPKYEHKKIEKKWRKNWEKSKVYKTQESSDKPKYYVLDMFPYPSGAGLHVGHPKGYIATDVVARMKMMRGFNVLHPMGWDAFGLPAENYAIQNKVHPREATEKNVATFKKQLGLLGFTYDWDREVNTTDSEYYKWTQWTFLQMYKKGLAFESNEPVNWCPKCQTGLANEDLDDGKCERCGTVVERKPMRQWVLKITKYADRLLNDIDKLKEWPEPIKEMQRNWIGRSEGAEINFFVIPVTAAAKAMTVEKTGIRSSGSPIRSGMTSEEKLKVFTIRPDTIFGASYLVVAPEHSLIENGRSKIDNYAEVEQYVVNARNKSDLERTDLAKEKTGVELKGLKAVNPATNEELPIFVADYVITGYGTGAIMAVPAHDERDWEFAKKYGLQFKQVVMPNYLDAGNPPRAGKKDTVRNVVHIILRNRNDKTVLIEFLKGDHWGSNKPINFIIGGVEDGESEIEAATREIKEETGYVNVRFIEKIPLEVQSNFFAVHKDVNRKVHVNTLVFDLVGPEMVGVTEEENNLHDIKWMPEKEVSKIISFADDKMVWKFFYNGGCAFTADGILINSGEFTGIESENVKEKVNAWLEEKGIGAKKVQYKLRDWVFSRQRYWGEPIPLVHCENCQNKKYKYILLHGYSANSTSNFLPWLKVELEKQGHTVWIPDLPNTDKPQVDEQVQFVLNNTPFTIDENTIVVGHSLGAVVTLKLLEKFDEKIAKVVLVDGFIRPEFADMPRPDVAESCDWDFNFTGLKNLCDDFVVLSDSRYEVITKGQDQELSKLLDGKLIVVESAGKHFRATEEQEIPVQLVNNGWVPVPENELPLELPKVKNYAPSGTGESPLANIHDWVNTMCPVCGGKATRETNTMPQWAGSCWYYLAYSMLGNQNVKIKNQKYEWRQEKIDYWNPVDLYVGGAEHATRHLIYARFWHKFLYDIGKVKNEEPFTRLQNVGLILAEDGRKMSKRWNNVINPDDVVEKFGADAMRIYEMFMGPFDQPCAWSTQGLVGAQRFIEKVWSLQDKLIHVISTEVEKSLKVITLRDLSTPLRSAQDDNERLDSRFLAKGGSASGMTQNEKLTTLLHQSIKKVSDDIEKMRFNTAISQLMILVNEMSKEESVALADYLIFLKLLSPFAPHLTEELWNVLGNKESIFLSDWPKYDADLAKDSEIILVVQVNGKVRDTIVVPAEISEEEAKKMALTSGNTQKWLEGKTLKKVIYVKGKLVSIVV